MKMQGYCDVFKWTLLSRTLPEVKYFTSDVIKARICTPSVSNAIYHKLSYDAASYTVGGGRVVRWCWINFQCRGVLLIWIRVGLGPTALAVGAGGGCLDIFSFVYHFSFLSPSLWETARYRLKYCLKGP